MDGAYNTAAYSFHEGDSQRTNSMDTTRKTRNSNQRKQAYQRG